MRGLCRRRRQWWLSLLCLAGLLLGRPMHCSSSTPGSRSSGAVALDGSIAGAAADAAMLPQPVIPAVVVAAVLPQQHEPAETTAPSSSSSSIPPPSSSSSSSLHPEDGKTTSIQNEKNEERRRLRPRSGRRRQKRHRRRPRRIDAFLAQLHGEADLDRDGHVTFEECYARILLFYIYVNRQAEIAPPTRTELANLYHRAGWTTSSSSSDGSTNTSGSSGTEQPPQQQQQQYHYKGLDADEFTRLAKTLVSRAASRLLVHKIVTIILAPYVALSIMHALDDDNNDNNSNAASFFSKKVTGGAAVTRFLRTRFALLLNEKKSHPLMIPPFVHRQLTSRSFWLSVFMVLCIKTLPDLALALMNYYFDETRSPFVHRYLDFRDDNHDGVDDREEQQEEEITTGGSNGAAVVVVDDANEMKDTGTPLPPPPPGATSSPASLATDNLEMAATAAPPPLTVVVPSMLERKTSEERYYTTGVGDDNNNSRDYSTSPVT